MITNAFKALCATILEAFTGGYGLLEVKDTTNTTVYLAGYFSSNFPRSVTTTYSTSATSAGIVLGTGTTAAAATDYRIETPITSGLTVTITYAQGLDNGNPYLEYTLNIANTSGSSVTISEIAYNQTVTCTTTAGSTSTTNKVLCLDHTLLSSAVTIANGASAAIKYRLKTVLTT